MYYSLSEQILVTLYSFVMGAFIGVIYDSFRLWRVVLGIGVTSPIAAGLYRKKLPFIKGKRGYIKPSLGKGALSLAVFFVFDLLFSITAAASYALFLHHACRGIIRWTYLISSFIGFMVYNRTISRITIGFLEVVVFFVRAILRYLSRIIAVPITPVVRLVKYLVRGTKDKIGAVVSACKIRRESKKISKTKENMLSLPVVGRSGRVSKNRN